MEPKKTVDNESFPTPYVHSGGRSKLPCSRLSEVFPVGSYHQRSGGNTAWTVQPPYSVFVGASWQNAKYNSPFVCGSDRVCLPGESELFSLLESGGTRWITSGCSFFSCCRSYDLTFFCFFFHLLLVFFSFARTLSFPRTHAELHDSMNMSILEYEKEKPYYFAKPTKGVDTNKDLRHRVCNWQKDKNSKKFECPRYRRFSHTLAIEYCEKVSMRLCDVNELLFEHNTRHCGAHTRFVWTTTKCKNLRADPDDDDSGYTDNWDPNYFWAVKQYPRTYSETGDRLCLHKDAILPSGVSSEITEILAGVGSYTKQRLDRNEVWLRTNTGSGKTWMFAGVSCCADTPHSPRYSIRYDDDNWSNEQSVWPPALRKEGGGGGIRKGWKYTLESNGQGGTTTQTFDDGSMKMLYQTQFAFKDPIVAGAPMVPISSCKKAYDKCMEKKSASTQYLCDMENCKFLHGPFTHHTVEKTIKFTSPIRRVRLNVRMWAAGDWKNGATIRLLVDGYEPVSGVTKFGNKCDRNLQKTESWREPKLFWSPRATEKENTVVCIYDLSVEFDLGTDKNEIKLIFQELGDPQLDKTAIEGHRWWGFNHLQVWSTEDVNGEKLKETKRAVTHWGQFQEIEMVSFTEKRTDLIGGRADMYFFYCCCWLLGELFFVFYILKSDCVISPLFFVLFFVLYPSPVQRHGS